MEWLLTTATLAGADDLAACRSRLRLLADHVGLEGGAQTSLIAATVELAGNAIAHAGGGTLRLALAAGTPPALVVAVTDQGAGLERPETAWEGRGGLALVRRLIERVDLETSRTGTTVRLVRPLPHLDWPTDAAAQEARATEIAARLAQAATPSAFEDVVRESHALLRSQAEIERLNAELEDTNRGVVALYAELDERAEQLREASELKSRFLSNMSHEFRTPLNSILALARLLLDEADGPLTAEQTRQVGYIRRSAESLAELVNDLLDLAKVEAGKLDLRPRSFTVQELFGALRGVMKPLQQSDAVDLVFDEPIDCPPLFTDEAKLAQVLRNLISNALKFTETGEVRVSARYEPETAHCIFTVVDTGIGIAAENHELVFHEFSQVASRLQGRAKGTGLGLPLSRRLAELMGGALTLKSTMGEGSQFTVSIPTLLPQADAPAEPPVVDVATAQGGVLLIDDEETSRYVQRQMLGSLAGLRVIEADSGAAGLQRTHRERPDVILLDLRMPGMDGFEVLERLAADPDTRDIPVIVCTSSVLMAHEHARLRHARTVLSKAALSRDMMAAVIAPFLQSPRADAT
ncbi:MAG: response regulator [Rhodospirillales bacterium]|nr:response regulator [Rhodospirillales bacterium]